MIRINLLGIPKPKKGKAAAAAVSGEGPNGIIIGVVILAVALAGNGYYYMRLNSEHTMAQQRLLAAQQKNKSLSETKLEYDKLQQQVAVVKRRYDVIEKLHDTQTGYPMDMLNTIASTISNTDAVWLITMQDRGNAIALEGSALSSDAVANLIANLRKTGFFKSVDFENTFQDNTNKNMNSFTFSLVCQKNAEEKGKS